MNAHSNETEAGRNALAISIWENEGGTPAPDTMDDQCGRRIDADRSWAVYHVFTGAPARVGGNLRNIERRIKRIRLSAPARSASETEAR
ncbi:hypothetical protein A8M32_26395 [Sinorhizobium alkalisoli]|uniref:Uncharacterized protein n=1 Tax=Sinorhizobium alkalisoli TaxID=1752398 RepID=A0A1E3V5F5_9HYPH|nr:hypothetical protein A8M32_26395 [Sinorhizobium alkalisoli]QFI67201.1 hypothetical protein EKH55_2327 [Sinorhizobium alkalisoli]